MGLVMSVTITVEIVRIILANVLVVETLIITIEKINHKSIILALVNLILKIMGHRFNVQL